MQGDGGNEGDGEIRRTERDKEKNNQASEGDGEVRRTERNTVEDNQAGVCGG